MVPPAAFAGRFRAIFLFASVLVALGAASRVGLALFDDGPSLAFSAWLAPVLLLGAVYDAAMALWWAMPLALLAWLWPARWQRSFAGAALALCIALLGGWVFVTAAEFVFWNEFGTRFNFIAVDYLVYTREVMGNIRESYPLGTLFACMGLALALLASALARPLLRAASRPAGRLRARSLAFVAVAALTAAATALVDTDWKDRLGTPQRAQLAGNGPLEFFRAFRDNEIDFQRFYATLPPQQAADAVRAEYQDAAQYRLTGSAGMPIERWVLPAGAPRPLNVVLVSVESLGAEFVESLGGAPGLTPELERLGREGLFFTRLHATGTRTVRGLEAITLSVPPTPGHAVPMRPHHTGLFTLGGVLREQGYDAVYVYGGYSYFDNMKSFFGGNGYDVVDRTAIPKEAITHENIWGVADEDLYGQALREIDARVAAGRRVFAHVMTTSNHRPFTYPAGRIDLAPGTRQGAVKYTDHAIGRFLREARTRPWFDDTVFVIVADHTSIGRGKTDLATARYHIPMVIYAPKWIAPRRVDTLASQIDVAPTVLGVLNAGYRSEFFGRDILRDGPSDPHVFMANYQTVGFLDDEVLAELKPRRATRTLRRDSEEAVTGEKAREVLTEAIALYQVAAQRFSSRHSP